MASKRDLNTLNRLQAKVKSNPSATTPVTNGEFNTLQRLVTELLAKGTVMPPDVAAACKRLGIKI